MALRIRCVHCQSVLTVAETLCGKLVRCQKCQGTVKVPNVAAPQGPQIMERRPSQPMRNPAPPRTTVNHGRRPRNEDDPRPRRGEYDQDRRPRDDYYDDAPRPRSRRPRQSGSGMTAFVVIGAAVLLLAAIGGGVYWMHANDTKVADKNKAANKTARNDDETAEERQERKAEEARKRRKKAEEDALKRAAEESKKPEEKPAEQKPKKPEEKPVEQKLPDSDSQIAALKKAEADKLAELQKKAEADKLAELQKKAEADKLAELQKKAEADKLTDQQKKAEADKLAKAEADKLAEQKLAAEMKAEEDRRIAAENKKKEELAKVDAPPPAPDFIRPETTKKVKFSTAYLNVVSANGQAGEGSGFFAIEPGLVLTNAHVVGMLAPGSLPPRSIEIVAHSGQPNEMKLTGKLLGVDRDSDLALVRVEGDASKLPAPLQVELDGCSLTELQKVYIFGFPLGVGLGKEITASDSSVSSLRKDAEGALAQIQVNGGMHPGNSGGPVVDTRGIVVGVAVAGIVNTQINFAVPAEKIKIMLHGHAQHTELGDPYREQQAVKLPLKVNCLDPLQRIREVKLEIWTGAADVPRPASMKAPAKRAQDGPKQIVDMKYVQGVAKHEVTLPTVTLPEGHVYWFQPVIVTSAGNQHWGAATQFHPADAQPLERVAANLSFKANTAQRTLKIAAKSIIRINIGQDSKQIGDMINLDVLEVLEKNGPNVGIKLGMGKGAFTIDDTGKKGPRDANAQAAVMRNLYVYQADDKGMLTAFAPTTMFNVNPLPVRMEAEEMAELFSSCYQFCSIPLPNRQVSPMESWPAKMTMTMSGGKRRTSSELNLTCTYEGSRTVGGKSEAMVRLTGEISHKVAKGRNNGRRPKDRVTGFAVVDVTSGFVSKLKMTVTTDIEEEAGISASRVFEVSVKRTAGNPNNITLPDPNGQQVVVVNPGPGPGPGFGPGPVVVGPVVKGTVILQKNDTLTQADPPNPKRPGTQQKIYAVKLTQGKTYIIDLKQAPGAFWDPYLMLYLGSKLIAEDDDGGEGLNARIVFTADKTGVYRIAATSFVPVQNGPFQLTVLEVGDEVAKAPPVNPNPKFDPPPKNPPPKFDPPPKNPPPKFDPNPPVNANFKELAPIGTGVNAKVHKVSFAPDGNTVFAACDGGDVQSLLVNQAQNAGNFFVGAKASVTFMAVTPDGKYLVCSSINKTVHVYEVAAKKELAVFQQTSQWPTAVAIAPDGKNIFTVGFGAPKIFDVKMINVASRQEKLLLQVAAPVDAVAASPDGTFLAVGTGQNDVIVFDLKKNQTAYVLKGHSKHIWTVAFSPDSKLLASTSSDRTVKIWNVATGNEVRTLFGHNNPVSSAAFSPDGKTLITSAGGVRAFDKGDDFRSGEIRFWDLTTGALLHQIQTTGVSCVAFSPKGDRAVAGNQGQVRVFEVRSK